MRLSDAKKGSSYIVLGIDLDLKVKRRLQMLGMTHGTAIDILNKKISGPMIIKVRGTRFAVGKKFCDGIILED
ncbi:MAG: ferrous iron transport protein A [Firmicutes bacterium]|nr:ferrous iron transport protein A [Bacillota bacterium]HAL63436.1 ferrous iron transport protein A [Clostridiales bacterium]